MKILQILPCDEPLQTGPKGEPITDVAVIPETAIVRPGTPFFMPDWGGAWSMRLLRGVVVDRLGRCIASKFAYRYYNTLIVALQPYPLDETTTAAAPSVVKAFDGSLLTAKMPQGCMQLNMKIFSLPRVDCEARLIEDKSIRFDVKCREYDEAVAYASNFFTLHTGDIVLVPSWHSLDVTLSADTRVLLETPGSGQVLLNHKIK